MSPPTANDVNEREMERRDKSIQRVLVIEGSANLVVLVAKAAVGLTTGSLAILAESIHSLGDVANNAVAFFVVRFSSQPPDREHPWGHRKFETLAVFVLATLLTVLAIELALQAMEWRDREVLHSGWGLPVMLCVLGVNITVALWEGYMARKLRSPILGADARHTVADVLATSGAIVGWQLGARGHPGFDAILALVVAGIVLYLAWGLFKKVIPELVESYAIEPEKLAPLVAAVPGVLEVRGIRSRWVGSHPVVDLTVTVDPEMSIAEGHRIADAIETALRIAHAARDVTVHVEPAVPSTDSPPGE